MAKSQRSFRFISRIALVAITSATLLSITAAGANAAGFLFLDSVKEFLGLQPTQTSVLTAQPAELNDPAVEPIGPLSDSATLTAGTDNSTLPGSAASEPKAIAGDYVPEGLTAAEWRGIREAHEAWRAAMMPRGEEAYLKASNTDALDQFGGSVAVSGDTVVVGAYGKNCRTT